MGMTAMRSVFILSVLFYFEAEGVCKTGPLNEFEKMIIEKHNEFRARHEDTAPLCYGESGEDIVFNAQYWAEHLAEKNIWKHHPNPRKFGENMSWNSFTTDEADPVEFALNAVKTWYLKEVVRWNFEAGKSTGGMTVHFTQTVWQGSKQVNCGFTTYQPPGEPWKKGIVVCQYFPKGNNVRPSHYGRFVGAMKPMSGDEEGAEEETEQEEDKESECLKVPYKPGDKNPQDLYKGCKKGPLSEFEQVIVDKHNEFRARHAGTPPICYSEEVGKEITFKSQYWADYVADNDIWKHHPNPRKFGENMSWNSFTVDEPDKVAFAADAVETWYYREQERWDFELGKSKGGITVHFTQLIWSTTQLVNCAYRTYQPPGKSYKKAIVVCQYFPRGNYVKKTDFKNYVGGFKPICPADEEENTSEEEEVVVEEVVEEEVVEEKVVEENVVEDNSVDLVTKKDSSQDENKIEGPENLVIEGEEFPTCSCWTRECNFCRNKACTIKQDLEQGITVKATANWRDYNSIMLYDDEGEPIGAFQWNKRGILLDGCVACVTPKSLKGKCILHVQHLWQVSITNGRIQIRIYGELVYENELREECLQKYSAAKRFAFNKMPPNSTFAFVPDAMEAGEKVSGNGCA